MPQCNMSHCHSEPTGPLDPENPIVNNPDNRTTSETHCVVIYGHG